MKQYAPVHLICLTLTLIMLSGCASFGSRINRMHVSMTKHDARNLLGGGYTARAAKVDAHGNVLDLWEYTEPKTKQSSRIYFLNDKVSQWGHREDLDAFPDLYLPKHRN